jgi:hypothetical protein
MYCRVKKLMMEVVRTSETSVNNYFKRQYIPEDKYELHTRRRENLKSHMIKFNLEAAGPLRSLAAFGGQEISIFAIGSKVRGLKHGRGR